MRLHPNAQTMRYVVRKDDYSLKFPFHPDGPRRDFPQDMVQTYKANAGKMHAHRAQAFTTAGLNIQCAGCYGWQTPDQAQNKPESMIWCIRCHEVAYCSQGCRFMDYEFGQHRFLCRTAALYTPGGPYSATGACGFQNYTVHLPRHRNLPELDDTREPGRIDEPAAGQEEELKIGSYPDAGETPGCLADNQMYYWLYHCNRMKRDAIFNAAVDEMKNATYFLKKCNMDKLQAEARMDDPQVTVESEEYKALEAKVRKCDSERAALITARDEAEQGLFGSKEEVPFDKTFGTLRSWSQKYLGTEDEMARLRYLEEAYEERELEHYVQIPTRARFVQHLQSRREKLFAAEKEAKREAREAKRQQQEQENARRKAKADKEAAEIKIAEMQAGLARLQRETEEANRRLDHAQMAAEPEPPMVVRAAHSSEFRSFAEVEEEKTESQEPADDPREQPEEE